VVTSIVAHSLHEQRQLAETINARITAVSSTNDIVAASSNMMVDLRELVEAKVKPFQSVKIDGPSVRLPSNTARNLSLVFHELCTNAVKHGSLSAAPGSLLIRWSNSAGQLQVQWQEEGGPTIEAPQRRGFGTRLIKTLIVGMGGTISANFDPSGLTVTFSVPVRENAA